MVLRAVHTAHWTVEMPHWVPVPVTPAEFLAARKALGLSQREMAERLGLARKNGRRTIQRYEKGDVKVPYLVERELTPDLTTMSDQETATIPAGLRRRIETAEAAYKYAIEEAARIADREAEVFAARANEDPYIETQVRLHVRVETARRIAAEIRRRGEAQCGDT